MITISEYIEWYKKQKREMLESGSYGSEPKFLFKPLYPDDDPSEWRFDPDNWNGGDILRHYFYDNVYESTNIDLLEIKYYWINDQTTIFIFSPEDFYEISWYKNRGRTESIKMNGNPIYIDEYIDLCNKLNVPLK
jgi:hypothetical protein